MTSDSSLKYRLSRLGVAAITALLLVSTLAVGLHHHADGAAHDDCAICTVGQAPAQQTAAICAPSAPVVLLELVTPIPTSAPRAIVRAVSASRAPPQA
jgi:hypothetical protein